MNEIPIKHNKQETEAVEQLLDSFRETFYHQDSYRWNSRNNYQSAKLERNDLTNLAYQMKIIEDGTILDSSAIKIRHQIMRTDQRNQDSLSNCYPYQQIDGPQLRRSVNTTVHTIQRKQSIKHEQTKKLQINLGRSLDCYIYPQGTNLRINLKQEKIVSQTRKNSQNTFYQRQKNSPFSIQQRTLENDRVTHQQKTLGEDRNDKNIFSPAPYLKSKQFYLDHMSLATNSRKPHQIVIRRKSNTLFIQSQILNKPRGNFLPLLESQLARPSKYIQSLKNCKYVK